MFLNPSIYASVEIDSDAHDNNHAGQNHAKHKSMQIASDLTQQT